MRQDLFVLLIPIFSYFNVSLCVYEICLVCELFSN